MLLTLAVACAPDAAPDGTLDDASDAGAAPRATPNPPPRPAVFTVRGRWADPRALTWRWDEPSGPLPVEACTAAVELALAAWQPSGLVAWRKAAEDDPADVTFGWRRGDHGDALGFGRNSAAAHTGPVAAGTFVHVDADRAWSVAGDGDTRSLTQALMHEIGHVLGLDHTPDPDALMFPDPVAMAPTASDLAGLHSLYGGGSPGAGDLLAVSSPGALARPVLCGVAPPGQTDWRLFDTDADGADELLVWRTDVEGHGMLTLYHFASGRGPGESAEQPPRPVLVGMVGPLLGVVPPGATLSVHQSPPPETAPPDSPPWRWLVITPAADAEDAGLIRAYAFDARGRLVAPDPIERRAITALLAEQADAAPNSGDAAPDSDDAAPDSGAATPNSGHAAVDDDTSRRGDLDGDGRIETITRRG